RRCRARSGEGARRGVTAGADGAMEDALAEMRAELATLRAGLRAVQDRQAIADLIAAYGPAVDRGDGCAAADLWAADGTYDLGPLGVARGRAGARRSRRCSMPPCIAI
ncbi:MAG: nuclear transport factor 2 family protein, partial [Sphingomonas sp.]